MAFLTACHEDSELSGGRHHSVIGIKPVAFPNGANGAGVLERIVHDWEQGDIARPHVINRAGMLLRMDGDGFLDICPTREPDRYFSIGAPYIKVGGVWTKINLGQANRNTNAVWWSTTNADVGVIFAGHYVKPGTIRLKTNWRPPGNQVAFPVGLTGLTRSGNQLLRDGLPVLTMRAPHVEDLDNAEDVRKVAHEFVNVAGQNYVLLTLPTLETGKRWLIDPTLVLQPDAAAGKDNLLLSATPTFNLGINALVLYSSTYKPGLIEFDLSAIPSVATCIAASLTATHTNAGAAGAFTVTISSIAVGNSAWTEGTKNNTQAAAGESCWGGLASDGGAGYTILWAGSAGLSTVITDYEAAALGSFSGDRSDANGTTYTAALTTARVQAWFGVVNTNYGIRLVQSADLGGLASSDHATAAYRPQLTVDWMLPASGRALHGLLNRSIL